LPCAVGWEQACAAAGALSRAGFVPPVWRGEAMAPGILSRALESIGSYDQGALADQPWS
jgi:hypothetical protein